MSHAHDPDAKINPWQGQTKVLGVELRQSVY